MTKSEKKKSLFFIFFLLLLPSLAELSTQAERHGVGGDDDGDGDAVSSSVLLPVPGLPDAAGRRRRAGSGRGENFIDECLDSSSSSSSSLAAPTLAPIRPGTRRFVVGRCLCVLSCGGKDRERHAENRRREDLSNNDAMVRAFRLCRSSRPPHLLLFLPQP